MKFEVGDFVKIKDKPIWGFVITIKPFKTFPIKVVRFDTDNSSIQWYTWSELEKVS
jgi:hypothetical protein